jgi:AcrR family transcriptional regulator
MVSPPMPTPKPETGRRLAPGDRRQEIVDAARRLFAMRPYSSVSTAEIAEQAGVARSLVHHYFGGIRGVFLAVAAEGALRLNDARTAGTELSFEARTAHNLAAHLDVIADNRETWMALVGQPVDPTDADIAALVLAARERAVEITLEANRDVVADTPQARFALRCFSDFTIAATRAWLLGERSRDETEQLLLTTGRLLLTTVIPSLSADGRHA